MDALQVKIDTIEGIISEYENMEAKFRWPARYSRVGTILFLIITRNRLPSYLGSSFAFIAPILAAMSPGGPGMAGALFGIFVVGLVLALVGLLVRVTGTGWIDALLPPVVAGAIVALIGFNLASAARDNFVKAPVTAVITLAAVILATVVFRGILGRLSIVLGVVVGYLVAVLRGEVDYAPVETDGAARAAARIAELL